MGDPQDRRYFRGGGIPVITCPVRVLVISAAAGCPLPDRGYPPGGVLILGTRCAADSGDHRRITRRPQTSIEHIFEYATRVRQESSRA